MTDGGRNGRGPAGRGGAGGGDGGDQTSAQLRQAFGEAQLRAPDDVTLRRMWGHVAEPGRRRRAPRWMWFAGGMGSTAALAVAIAVWLWPRSVAPPAPVAAAPLPVAVRTAAAPGSSDADDRPAVVTPGTVRTGAGETLRLALRGGTEARLGSSSVMSLDKDERPTVEAGEVGFSVPHQPPGRTFVVQAGSYRVLVIGTKFQLRIEGANDRQRVFVSVEQGVVEVWDRGQLARLARLAPGESWTGPDAAQGVEQEVEEKAPVAAHHPVARARVTAMTMPRAASSPANATPPVAPGEGGPAAAAAADPAAQARAALAAGEVTRALALYRSLAQRGGPAAENAEYEIGKILRDRLGQPANAIAAWRRYRSEHPDGILRVEADVSIIETLVNGGEADGALAEANDFLRRHPESERRAEMARVAGDLYRARSDCRRAVAAYQSALSAPRVAGAVAEAATFHRASCLVQLGDPAGAEAARDYLRGWPAGRFRAAATRLLAADGRLQAEGPSRP